jgi:hypothetical protein
MGIYFRRRLLLSNLLHSNVTGRGVGLSLFVRGFHAGISASEWHSLPPPHGTACALGYSFGRLILFAPVLFFAWWYFN